MLPSQAVDANRELLTKAKKLFLSKQFDKASNIYSIILSQDFNNKEAQIVSYLIDLASFNPSYALNLANDVFRYKLLKKEYMYDLVYEKIDDYFIYQNNKKINHSNTISYLEFKKTMKYHSDFKLSFYLTHVYTKISFANEDEIVEFLNILFDNHLNNLAIKYFEKFSHLIIDSKHIIQISKRLRKS